MFTTEESELMNKFDENSRVKIPAIVHATRLGYNYLSIKDNKYQIEPRTNIFKNIFKDSLNRINNLELSDLDIDNIINELCIILSNDDLGRAFYKVILNGYKNIKLIDLENEDNNTYNVVTELTYQNGEDEFRPDVIMLINGMPLSFIEVKKPNNREGILAERNRINDRFKNKKFIRFANLTQILVFSNNQEYNDDSVVPIEGAFYGTPNYGNVFFNCFREEDTSIYSKIKDIDYNEENKILKDNNYVSIKGTNEYSTNKSSTTPTNRLMTSLYHKTRILKILKYGIAYVEKTDDSGITYIQKHIMRYQQLFATLAIENKLDEGVKRGIIWHTQGSGKTALAYYNVKYLTDYYQKKNKIAKFYFVVDRLDLLKQASDEFQARGLEVVKVNSKDEFKKNIASSEATASSGNLCINVINIQKFSDDSVVKESDYSVEVQRIYFLDEAHRSYNPKGSFLSNLLSSDRNAVIIALTGTPLIGNNFKTKDIFGGYIHKYYYNKSIIDGYTLKLIREGIETSYKTQLQQTLDEIKREVNANDDEIFANPKYTKALTKYIVDDFKKSRIAYDDNSIGGMIVCDSQAQARRVFADLDEYDLSKALILHNEDDKTIRSNEITDFKNGKIDLLVVQNMLLTGFDAPRLKKIYLGRVIREHNLLQTLTRVNRPYKNFKYGYVVDFADIRDEFDRTNAEYFKELQDQLGEDFNTYSNIFLSKEEIEKSITEIKNKLFQYDIDNLENFTSQINELNKKDLLDLKKIMITYKDLYNVIKSFNYTDLMNRIKIDRVSKMIKEVDRRIDIKNLTDKENSDTTSLLNVALADIDFSFKKISEEELVIADKYKQKFDEVRKEFLINIDKDETLYIKLYREFENLFRSSNFEDITTDEIEVNLKKLDELNKKIHSLNAKNDRYLVKYLGDEKYVKIHKRVLEKIPEFSEVDLNEILINLKTSIDDMLLKRYDIMDNESYFKNTIIPLTVEELENHNIPETEIIDDVEFFTNLIVENYLFERKANNYE
jgi:type I restriction enzyme, R subunit